LNAFDLRVELKGERESKVHGETNHKFISNMNGLLEGTRITMKKEMKTLMSTGFASRPELARKLNSDSLAISESHAS
jgi:hypothetical protein